MTSKEQQIEELATSIEEFRFSKAPPIFELYAALVAISLAIMLLLMPGVLNQPSAFYILLRAVMPQLAWAFVFLFAGVLSAVGMLADKDGLRITALFLLTGIFGLVAAFYFVIFPSVAGILMAWISLFSAVSIPLVKYTSVR